MRDGTQKTRGKCAHCGMVFEKIKKDQKYCCKKCAGLAKRGPTRPCKFCGKPLSYEDNTAGRFYCSDQCKIQARKRKPADIQAVPENRWVSCHCCGKMFEATSKKNIHCSQACRKKAELARLDVQRVKIVVLHPLPVDPHMQPVVGKIYDARRHIGGSGAVYIIEGIGKYGLLVRKEEVKEI